MTENQSSNLPKPGDTYEIPVEGSLGLLATGYKGLLLWRKKKAEVALKNSTEINIQKNSAGDGK